MFSLFMLVFSAQSQEANAFRISNPMGGCRYFKKYIKHNATICIGSKKYRCRGTKLQQAGMCTCIMFDYKMSRSGSTTTTPIVKYNNQFLYRKQVLFLCKNDKFIIAPVLQCRVGQSVYKHLEYFCIGNKKVRCMSGLHVDAGLCSCHAYNARLKVKQFLNHNESTCMSTKIKKCSMGTVKDTGKACGCSYNGRRYNTGQFVCVRRGRTTAKYMCVFNKIGGTYQFQNMPGLKCCSTNDVLCKFEETQALAKYKQSLDAQKKTRANELRQTLLRERINAAKRRHAKLKRLRAQKRRQERTPYCLTFKNMPWFKTSSICAKPVRKMIWYNHCTAYGPKCKVVNAPIKFTWCDVLHWVCKKSERRKRWDFPKMTCPGRQYNTVWLPNGRRDIRLCFAIENQALVYYVNGARNPDILGTLQRVMSQHMNSVRSGYLTPIANTATEIGRETNKIITAYSNALDGSIGLIKRKADEIAIRLVGGSFWRNTMSKKMVGIALKSVMAARRFTQKKIKATFKRQIIRRMFKFTGPVEKYLGLVMTKQGKRTHYWRKALVKKIIREMKPNTKKILNREMKNLKKIQKQIDETKKAKMGKKGFSLAFAMSLTADTVGEGVRILLHCGKYEGEAQKACLGIQTAKGYENLIFEMMVGMVICGLEASVFEIWSHSLATSVAGSLAALTAGAGALSYLIIYAISKFVLSFTAALMAEGLLRPVYNQAIAPARPGLLQGGHAMVQNIKAQDLVCFMSSCNLSACVHQKKLYNQGNRLPDGRYCWNAYFTCPRNGRQYKHLARQSANSSTYCFEGKWQTICTLGQKEHQYYKVGETDGSGKICTPSAQMVKACYYNRKHYYKGQRNTMGQYCQSDGTWKATPPSRVQAPPVNVRSAPGKSGQQKVRTASAQRLPLAKGWRNYGGPFATATYVKQGNIVTINGLIKGGRWGHLATLPAGARPRKRLIFNLNNHQFSSRVDILPDGRVFWIAGGRAHRWISLSGIVFSTAVGRRVPLLNRWKNFGYTFDGVRVNKEGGIVTITGLIRGRFTPHIMTLPSGYRPRKRLIFNLNNHQYTSRVDILPDGRVFWIAGGRSYGWLSLSGIVFSTSPGQGLRLLNGWKNFGATYAHAQVHKYGKIGIVSGLLRGTKWGHPMVRLPVSYRPKTIVNNNANNHAKSARLDTNSDGTMRWIAGGRRYNWLSISGTVLILNTPTR